MNKKDELEDYVWSDENEPKEEYQVFDKGETTMIKITGRLMSSNITKNRTKFAPVVLEDLEKKQPIVPVYFNFTGLPIGKVDKYELINGELVIEGTIFSPPSDIEDKFIVPRGIVKIEDIEVDSDGYRIIKKMELESTSITDTPADPTLSKIKKEKP